MNHPGIYQVGRVRTDGDTIVVSGWGLTTCSAHCTCHRSPTTGQLTIRENQQLGLLGLLQHRACDCCGPWTADELAAVVRDLADVAALETA